MAMAAPAASFRANFIEPLKVKWEGLKGQIFVIA
jgi:hypothetical protein